MKKLEIKEILREQIKELGVISRDFNCDFDGDAEDYVEKIRLVIEELQNLSDSL